MQTKFFLFALSLLPVFFGDSQVRSQANLFSSTTSTSVICTSTSTTRETCTSTSGSSFDTQSTPSLAPNEFSPASAGENSYINSNRPINSADQDERIDEAGGVTSSSEVSSFLEVEGDRSIADIEQEVHKQINQYRAQKKLPPLTLNESISEQAHQHSQEMARGAVAFGHDGFTERARAINNVISYSGTAENVGYNKGYTNVAKQVVQDWLKSTGHRQNIEGEYNITGIGVAKNAKEEYYFTQIFIRSRNTQQ